MIECRKIAKAYDKQQVIEDFSYVFEATGFYLLLGESGSGKTTLLNLISGMIPFDEGAILVNGREFLGRVASEGFDGGMDYITQDPFFVDYLSVMENLKAAINDDAAIYAILDQFGLTEQAGLLPGTLSGGERQRLALARAMLTKKKILLLDEPTASLDMENKQKLFTLIKDLSKNCLVICSSHDQTAIEYADQVISFEKDSDDNKRGVSAGGQQKQSTKKATYFLQGRGRRKGLVKYLAKWFSSKRRGRMADILLLIFFTLAFMLCLLADTPEGKIQSSAEYVYKLNSLTFKAKTMDTEYVSSLKGQYGITDVVLDYGWNLPPEEDHIDAANVNVIPFDKDSFRLSDRIAVGSYFQDKYDVILSSEMANRLARGKWDSLIGMTLTVQVREEKVHFRIVGVFDYFNDFERQYLKSLGVSTATGSNYRERDYENQFFVSSLVTKEFWRDLTFCCGDIRYYQIYFDSYQSMLKFADAYDGSHGDISMQKLASGVEKTFQIMTVFLLPLSFLMILLSVLFYANILGTELAYNGRFVSAFHYMGYDIKYIIRVFAILNMLRLLGICAISIAGTLLITAAVNWINEQMVIIGFRIFTYNPWLIFAFVGTITIGSVIAVYFFLRRVKMKSWYENIIETRDLL